MNKNLGKTKKNAFQWKHFAKKQILTPKITPKTAVKAVVN